MHSHIHGHRFPCRDLFFNDLNLSKLVSISKSLDIFISFAVLIIANSQQIIPECLKTIIKFYITSHGFCGSAVWRGCSRNGFSSLYHVRGFSWKDLKVAVTQQLEAG